jgi:hypothetical protein
MKVPLATRLLLRAVGELEERGHRDAARAGYRRLWASLPAGEATVARVDVALALVRLGLGAQGAQALAEGCAAWRSLGPLHGTLERRARRGAMGLVRAALEERRAAEASTIADAEAERAPGHALALYARGRLAVLEGDALAGETLLERAAAGPDAPVATRARVVLRALPDERLPRPGESLPDEMPLAARIGIARRLARSAGRYARVRGLDILLAALPKGPAEAQGAEALAAEILAAAAAHVDVVGSRLTDIERDRLREILGRMPQGLAGPAAHVTAVLELRARVAPLAPAARVELLANEGPATVVALARAVRRGSGPWPESSDPHQALAAEVLRVVDALSAGGVVRFDRLLALWEAAGATAVLVPTLWALFPVWARRHAALGLAKERLRPVLAAVLDHGPLCSLDPALLSCALDALGEDDLAERAARRAAEEGHGAVLAVRLVRRAFRLAEAQPEEALRLLERADRIA